MGSRWAHRMAICFLDTLDGMWLGVLVILQFLYLWSSTPYVRPSDVFVNRCWWSSGGTSAFSSWSRAEIHFLIVSNCDVWYFNKRKGVCVVCWQSTPWKSCWPSDPRKSKRRLLIETFGLPCMVRIVHSSKRYFFCAFTMRFLSVSVAVQLWVEKTSSSIPGISLWEPSYTVEKNSLAFIAWKHGALMHNVGMVVWFE